MFVIRRRRVQSAESAIPQSHTQTEGRNLCLKSIRQNEQVDSGVQSGENKFTLGVSRSRCVLDNTRHSKKLRMPEAVFRPFPR